MTLTALRLLRAYGLCLNLPAERRSAGRAQHLHGYFTYLLVRAVRVVRLRKSRYPSRYASRRVLVRTTRPASCANARLGRIAT
jgi:hypothetical protein